MAPSRFMVERNCNTPPGTLPSSSHALLFSATLSQLHSLSLTLSVSLSQSHPGDPDPKQSDPCTHCVVLQNADPRRAHRIHAVDVHFFFHDQPCHCRQIPLLRSFDQLHTDNQQLSTSRCIRQGQPVIAWLAHLSLCSLWQG